MGMCFPPVRGVVSKGDLLSATPQGIPCGAPATQRVPSFGKQYIRRIRVALHHKECMEDEVIYTRDFNDRDPYLFDLDGEIEHGAEFVTLFYLLELFEKFAYRNGGCFSLCRPRKNFFRMRVAVHDLYFYSDQDITFLATITSVCKPVQVAFHQKMNRFVLIADYRVDCYEAIDICAKDIEEYNPDNWEDLKNVLKILLQKTPHKRIRGYPKKYKF